jgi:hypothetical protein
MIAFTGWYQNYSSTGTDAVQIIDEGSTDYSETTGSQTITITRTHGHYSVNYVSIPAPDEAVVDTAINHIQAPANFDWPWEPSSCAPAARPPRRPSRCRDPPLS